MSKFRVIPSLLSNGVNLVKGENFDNWRTVGSVFGAVELFSRRDVDEIVLLDVNASREGRVVNSDLVAKLAKRLRIPFSVGGGVTSIKDIEDILASGADKVVIGKAALRDHQFLTSAAKVFGSQALVVSLDIGTRHIDEPGRLGSSGTHSHSYALERQLQKITQSGAGEVIFQNSDRDGTMRGLDLELLAPLLQQCEIPAIVAGGLGTADQAVKAALKGASGVAVGALFQFTQVTPTQVKDALETSGIPVRR